MSRLNKPIKINDFYSNEVILNNDFKFPEISLQKILKEYRDKINSKMAKKSEVIQRESQNNAEIFLHGNKNKIQYKISHINNRVKKEELKESNVCRSFDSKSLRNQNVNEKYMFNICLIKNTAREGREINQLNPLVSPLNSIKNSGHSQKKYFNYIRANYGFLNYK